MPYSDFTFAKISDALRLRLEDKPGLFSQIPPVAAVSDVFKAQMERNLPMAVGVSTEKGRSELLISPVLVELRELSGREVAVYSGASFPVDTAANLYGFCDFLISRSPTLLNIGAPVLAVVEAKREDLTGGVPQCIAEMYAARIFNERENSPTPIVHGVVTSGTLWRFLRLENQTVSVDLQDYSLENPERLLGILLKLTER